mmetsp:Transcript_28651/g.56294  ORF Transcript_28651/g.56294 Transcript_28651/m.56294 type:complete len:132 (+) Transcript_28651:542-937(+)
MTDSTSQSLYRSAFLGKLQTSSDVSLSGKQLSSCSLTELPDLKRSLTAEAISFVTFECTLLDKAQHKPEYNIGQSEVMIRHAMQTKLFFCGAPHSDGSSTSYGQHDLDESSQKICPQQRQWCLRRVNEKDA